MYVSPTQTYMSTDQQIMKPINNTQTSSVPISQQPSQYLNCPQMYVSPTQTNMLMDQQTMQPIDNTQTSLETPSITTVQQPTDIYNFGKTSLTSTIQSLTATSDQHLNQQVNDTQTAWTLPPYQPNNNILQLLQVTSVQLSGQACKFSRPDVTSEPMEQQTIPMCGDNLIPALPTGQQENMISQESLLTMEYEPNNVCIPMQTDHQSESEEGMHNDPSLLSDVDANGDTYVKFDHILTYINIYSYINIITCNITHELKI